MPARPSWAGAADGQQAGQLTPACQLHRGGGNIHCNESLAGARMYDVLCQADSGGSGLLPGWRHVHDTPAEVGCGVECGCVCTGELLYRSHARPRVIS
jgi:hypothetical protein